MVKEAIEDYRKTVLCFFALVEKEKMRRELFYLLNNLEDEYQAELAGELVNFLLTGRDTLWVKSRLLMTFYCIAKRLMGFETKDVEEDFDMHLYHLIESMNKQHNK